MGTELQMMAPEIPLWAPPKPSAKHPLRLWRPGSSLSASRDLLCYLSQLTVPLSLFSYQLSKEVELDNLGVPFHF